MNATRYIRIKTVLLALAFACLLAFMFHLSDAWRLAAFADDAPSEVEETQIEKVKTLIAVLPADPDSITEGDRSAIEAAQSAYDALPSEDQKTLDTTMLAKEQTYGRWLESAQWGLLARQPIDNSLAVVDGDYSAYVTSASSMGKSTSQRARSWTVVKLTVEGGKVTAVVRCNKESAFVNMRVGGVDYKANVVNGVPEFTVPILVNNTTTFTVDVNSTADSIAYQMETTLQLQSASLSSVTAAASKAGTTLGNDWSAYEDASVSAVMSAANALADAAVKLGVTTVELNVTTAALDSAIAGAVKKAVPTDATDQTTSNTKKKTSKKSKKKTNTLTSATSKVTGASRSQVVPTVSSGNGSGTTSRGLGNNDDDGEDDDDDEDKPSATSDNKGEAKPTEETIAKSSTTGGGSSTAPSASVREVSISGNSGDTTVPLVFVGGAAIAFVLAGMVARTLLFARAKDAE